MDEPAPDAPRLYLITPPIGDAAAFKPLLEAALGAVDIACVLLRVAARDEGEAKAILRVLVPVVQAHDAAALIERDARLAARVDADGVHLAWATGDGAVLDEALRHAATQEDGWGGEDRRCRARCPGATPRWKRARRASTT